MKLFQSLLFSVLFVSAIFFAGCNQDPTSVEPINTPGLSKLTIPAGATITNATLHLYVEDATGNNITTHQVNVPWTEAETWNTFFAKPAPQFEAASLGNFPLNAGAQSVDITALVQAWVAGTTANYGVLLNQPVSAPGFGTIRSSEYVGSGQPMLEVTYTPAGGGAPVTVQEPAFADTYIWSLTPDDSYGNDQYLRVAHIAEAEYRKYALIMFDIEQGEQNCETAYAFGDTPFCGLPEIGNWGWSEYINGNYTNTDIPIYAAAAHCDPANGTRVGTLSITYVGNSLTIDYTMNPGVTVEDVHMWIGSTPLPSKKGKLSSSPGSFNYNDATYPFNLTISNPFYVAVHFDVCF